MPHTPEKSLKQWLSKISFKVSPVLIDRELKSHPDYPSLSSITSTLDYLGIDNTAVRINRDQLHEVPVPFLAHLQINDGEFVIVENRDTLEKVYPGFFNNWTGVVVAVEKTPLWKHKENEELLRHEQKERIKKGSVVALVIMTALTNFFFATDMTVPILTIIALTGIFISWLIIARDLGLENSIADHVCGKEADCDAIIHSKGAKLFFGAGWSDIGITWFTTLLATVVLSSFAGNSSGVLSILSVLAVAAIPITFFSVYYQWQIEKKWCRLCLFTVGILWVQAGTLLPFLLKNKGITIGVQGVLFVFSILLLVSIAWVSFKAVFIKYKNHEKESFEAKSFKRGDTVFSALMKKQRRVETSPWENELQLGSSKAPVQVVVACNPYCRPCAALHEELHQLVQQFGNKMGLAIRFALSTKIKEDKRKEAVACFLRNSIQATGSMNAKDAVEYKQEMLHHWFGSMNYKEFTVRYPGIADINVEATLRQHEEWMYKSKIETTPTIFINGYELPRAYRMGDLSWIINSCPAFFSEQEQAMNNKLIPV